MSIPSIQEMHEFIKNNESFFTTPLPNFAIASEPIVLASDARKKPLAMQYKPIAVPKNREKEYFDYFDKKKILLTPIASPGQKEFADFFEKKDKLDEIKEYSKGLADLLNKEVERIDDKSGKALISYWYRRDFETVLKNEKIRKYIMDNREHPALKLWREHKDLEQEKLSQNEELHTKDKELEPIDKVVNQKNSLPRTSKWKNLSIDLLVDEILKEPVLKPKINLKEKSNNGLQATVYYWPNKNMGFGHVSMKVKTLEGYHHQLKDKSIIEKESIYISWAMGNNYETDSIKHGIEPIKFELIERSNDFNTFLNNYKKTDYFRSKTGGEYSFFKNNCAHCVAKMLKSAGYNIDLDDNWILRPSEVAKKSSDFISEATSKRIPEILNSCLNKYQISHTDFVQLINTLRLTAKNNLALHLMDEKDVAFDNSMIRKLEALEKLYHLCSTNFNLDNLNHLKLLFSSIVNDEYFGEKLGHLLEKFHSELICNLEIAAPEIHLLGFNSMNSLIVSTPAFKSFISMNKVTNNNYESVNSFAKSFTAFKEKISDENKNENYSNKSGKY